MSTNWLAIDVGGANLKLANGGRYAATQFFALWREPHRLAGRIKECLAQAPDCGGIAATMTGELADCFQTKREGVSAIVAALEDAAAGRPLRIYLTTGEFVAPRAAIDQPLLAAASNWHALAQFAVRFVTGQCRLSLRERTPFRGAKGDYVTGQSSPHAPREESGAVADPDAAGLTRSVRATLSDASLSLLIDLGSTTCDIIPIEHGQPATIGRTDPERLVASELVYTGVLRSPVCAVVSALPWRGSQCPTAQELFATTLDAYLLLGDLPEDPDYRATADGRPATCDAARDRMARAICADREMFSAADALAAAHTISEAQSAQIAAALQRVVAARWQGPPREIVLSGQGEFLIRRVIQSCGWEPTIISLGARLGPQLSVAATAHALAVLAREQLP